MINITVDLGDVEKTLQKFAANCQNTAPAMLEISELMRHSVEENFEAEGRPKWKKLKPETIKKRTKQGHWPGKILQVTGKLAASINTRHTNTLAAIGTNVEYAGIHQFGLAKLNIPARPFLKMEPEEIVDVEKILLRHLLK